MVGQESGGVVMEGVPLKQERVKALLLAIQLMLAYAVIAFCTWLY